MARSVDEIYNSILVEKAKRPELAVLSSTSATAIWRLWAYITAVSHNVIETFFDLFKAEVNDLINRKEFGTPSWFAEISKDFQLGDQITTVNGKTGYAVIDLAKRIVTRVAYKETDGVLTLKIAKGTGQPLTNSEVQQFESYIERRKPAGVQVSVISLNADKLRVTAEVFYDGIYTQDVIKAAVESALTDYMASLEFDGLVYRNKVIDAIQKVTGVVDVDLDTLQALAGITLNTIGRVYETTSGYLVQDNTSGFTFADTITYTPTNDV